MVRWEWLTLLAAQVALSNIFLVAVMVRTWKLGVDVVKTSNMAELFAMRLQNAELACLKQAENGEDEMLLGINAKVKKELHAELTKEDERWVLALK